MGSAAAAGAPPRTSAINIHSPDRDPTFLVLLVKNIPLPLVYFLPERAVRNPM
jgi:hypothetical protein